MKKTRKSLPVRVVTYIFFTINLVVAVWLGLCAAAAIISPLEYTYISLFSLTTPFAIAANITFIFFWLFSRSKWRALLSLATLIACYRVSLTIFGFNFFDDNNMAKKEGQTLKVISWNVHGMGIFNRPRDKEFEKSIIDFLQEEDADVLCLPEYYTPRDNFLKPYSRHILRNNGYKDFRFNIDNDLGTNTYLGTAVFSKYPFKNYEAHQLSPYIYLLQGDITLPNKSIVRTFFIHLTTFGLSDKDKAYIEQIKRKKTDIDSNIERSKTFISKFNQAFVKRANEAVKAAQIISESPYPVLICGDFNDLPGSYTYTVLRGELKDAFLEKGNGFGRTYNQILPTLRIDHMFYDPSALKLIGFRCKRTKLSDHNPLIANFEILENPAR